MLASAVTVDGRILWGSAEMKELRAKSFFSTKSSG